MFGRARRARNLWKGLACGAAAGLAASWTMNRFQAALSKATEGVKNNSESQTGTAQPKSESDSDDATMRTADWIATKVFHHPLTKHQKNKFGPVVHYSFGTITGALYGAISEFAPVATKADGALFGAAVFAGADELSLWALNLAGPPTRYPLSVHAQALASHFVYGVTTETVRRSMRKVI